MADEAWRTDTGNTGDTTDPSNRTSTNDRRSTSDPMGENGPTGRNDAERTRDPTGRDAPEGTPVLTAAKSSVSTKFVTTTEFRACLSELLELANRQPVTVASRGTRPRAVLVSPDFFDRACDALGEEPYARPPRSRLEEIMAENMQILEFL